MPTGKGQSLTVEERELLESGFYQCPTCALIWFGRDAIVLCPNGHGGRRHIEILCRTCDAFIPVSLFASHLTSADHLASIERHASKGLSG
jgi:hypothetical protein